MSTENSKHGSAETVVPVEGNTGWAVKVRASRAPRCPRTQARTHILYRDLGELHFALVVEPGPHEKGGTRTS